MFLPGIVLTGITFPGVMAHELAHELMCRATKTKVLDVCYYRWGNPAGYVLHEKPANVWKSLLISLVPFVFNSTTGFLLGMASAALYRSAGHLDFFSISLFYLGVSFAFHAFPSLQDVKAIDDELWKKETSLVAKLVCAPVVFIFGVNAVLNFVVVNMIFGLAVGGILPALLLGVR